MGIKTRVAITDKIGNMFQGESPEWPMYSFNRPAYAFWQGIANELQDMGYSQKDIKGILQSKHMRWLFDGDGHDQVTELGRMIAREQHRNWTLI